MLPDEGDNSGLYRDSWVIRGPYKKKTVSCFLEDQLFDESYEHILTELNHLLYRF